jgi:hypothetical protein
MELFREKSLSQSNYPPLTETGSSSPRSQQPPVSVEAQGHTLPSYFFIILILFHLFLGLASGLISSGYLTDIL